MLWGSSGGNQQLDGLGRSTALTASENWTSLVADCVHYAGLSVLCKADVDLQLSVEQSGDGTNWDASESVTVAANSAAALTFSIPGRWVRMRLLNLEASDASFTRLSCIGLEQGSPSSVSAQKVAFESTTAAALSVSPIKAKREAGKCFVASGRQYLAGQIVYLSNPAASGKNLHITRLLFASSWGSGEMTVYTTDVALTGGTAITPHNLLLTGGSSSAVAGDGFTTSPVVSTPFLELFCGLGSTQSIDLPEELVIPPGRGIYVQLSTPVDNSRISTAFFWYEEAV